MCYLYIIEATTSKNVKIGISDDPEGRLKELQSANYEALRICYKLKCHSREMARKLEAHLHEKYSDQRIRFEWFSVPSNEVYKYVYAIQVVSESLAHTLTHPAPIIVDPTGDMRTFIGLAVVFLGSFPCMWYFIEQNDRVLFYAMGFLATMTFTFMIWKIKAAMTLYM